MSNETEIIRFTAAPAAYDYSYVETLAFCGTNKKGELVRKIRINDPERADYQCARYGSGLYGVFTEAEIAEQIAYGFVKPFLNETSVTVEVEALNALLAAAAYMRADLAEKLDNAKDDAADANTSRDAGYHEGFALGLDVASGMSEYVFDALRKLVPGG